jgi:hypothetical protein
MTYVRREDGVRPAVSMVYASNGLTIISAVISTPAAAGFPLHVINSAGTIVQSFGGDDPAIDPPNLAAPNDAIQLGLRRYLVPGTTGTFWAYNPTRFTLEQYDLQGRLLNRVRHGLDGWYRAAVESGRLTLSADRGYPLHVVIPSDEKDLLWLVYQAPNAVWTPPRGPIDVSTFARIYDVVVEALDTRAWRVIASRRFPQRIALRLSDIPDALALIQPAPEVHGKLNIGILRLARGLP